MLNRFGADSGLSVAQEQCFFVFHAVNRTHFHIVFYRAYTRIVEINRALFISFSGYYNCIIRFYIGIIN